MSACRWLRTLLLIALTSTIALTTSPLLAQADTPPPPASATQSSPAPPAKVSGVPAVLVSPPVLSGAVAVGQTLSVTKGAWTSVEPWYVSYQWQRCDPTATCTNIADRNGPTYTIDGSDAGYIIQVIVTAEAGWDASEPDAQTPVSIVAGLVPAQSPSPATQPTIRGIPVLDGTISAQIDPWYGTPPIALAYQWLRCDTTGTNCRPIPAATASTYALGLADLGQSLEVTVTATNAAGSASATSTPATVQEPLTAAPPLLSPTGTITAPPAHTLVKGIHTFQWQTLTPTHTWANIAGAEKRTLRLNSDQQKTIRVVIVDHTSNACTTTCVIQTAITRPLSVPPHKTIARRT